jgi:hypothetical protein
MKAPAFSGRDARKRPGFCESNLPCSVLKNRWLGIVERTPTGSWNIGRDVLDRPRRLSRWCAGFRAWWEGREYRCSATWSPWMPRLEERAYARGSTVPKGF